MVCVLCFRLLSEGLPDDDDSSSEPENTQASAIAALSCGHVFHLVCITLWQNRETDTVCPRCSSSHLGLILVLHTESGELDRHDNAEEAIGQLSYSTLLNSAKQHASNWQELQKENKLLKLVIDMKDSRLHERQTTIGDLYRQLAALEYRVRELEGGEKESEEEEEYEKKYYFDGDYFTEDSSW
ncbi:hypothetical protein IWW57_003806 [Coemansia sp. S610]|nr:hypothetical protein IWW57_003806 [Coemansia sp. S610]